MRTETRETGASSPNGGPLIAARGLTCGYGAVSVVQGLELHVLPGEVVVLLGPNGVGKTTTLLTLVGELPPLAGNVDWMGSPTRRPLDWRARSGLGFVPEEKSVLMNLTTLENLRVASSDVELALHLFPELGALLSVKGGLLSGGEQQMLTLARTLARRPKLLVADELSLGLAPLVVTRLFEAVRAAAAEGVGVLLVEQHVRKVLPYADRAYVMTRGRIALSGTAEAIGGQLDDVEASYLAGAVPATP